MRVPIHKPRPERVSPEAFAAMLAAQDGKCAICGAAENSASRWGTTKRLAVDHCHSTQRLRKLLCSRCNSALGMLRDDPDLCDAAAEYLRSHL